MAQLIEQWFRLADEDRDGGVGGAEAVKFFTKSGLPKDVLGQIWEYASGGGAKLNMVQFGVAMRLVALAQASGGRLIPDQARMVAMGAGPQLPPPRLAGVTDAAPTPSIATYTPQITGLNAPPAAGAVGVGVGYSSQPTGGAPGSGGGGYVPQVTGGYCQPQLTGMRPPSPYTPQATGGFVGAGPTGGLAAAGATGGVAGVSALPGFPVVGPADMQRYQAAFLATDTDRDGLAKGSECLPMFIKSGLDKGLLKRMWDMVAGNAGSLNQEQFVKCMYLMDGCRRGAQLPAALPPGVWPQVSMAGPTGGMPGPAAAGMTGGSMQPTGPMMTAPLAGIMQQQTGTQMPPPAAAGLTGAAAAGFTGAAAAAAAGGPRLSSGGGVGPGVGGVVTSAPLPAENWSLDSQFGHKGAVKAITDAYDQTLPRIPDLPGKVSYEAKPAAAVGPSAVPDLDTAVASMLAPADKARWEAEQQEAMEKEVSARAAEAEAAAAKARIETFQAALSELVMFKSRVDVALLQATDSAARLTSEAEDTELRYHKARLAAQSQAEAGSAARQQLQALLARKQEASNKLELLQQELSMMANLNPAELVALEQEVGGLVAQVAAAEAKKAAMEMQLDSGKKQKELLSDRMSDLELAAAAGEGDIRRARQELEELQSKLASTQSTSQQELGEVGPLLGKAASAYRRLYSSAAAAGLEVPYEANLNNVGALVWLEQLMAGTADWVDDDSALSGYTVVNALPDLEGVPPALLRAAAIAAAQQPPIKPAAVMAAAAPAAPAPDEAAAPAAAAAAAGGEQAPAAAEVLTADAEPAAAAEKAAEPAVSEGKGKIKGAVAAAAATVAAAVAAGTAVAVPGSGVDADAGAAAMQPPSAAGAAAAAAAEAEAVPDAAAEEPAPAAVAAGFEDSAFGDGDAFAPADGAVEPAAAEVPAGEPLAAASAAAAEDEAVAVDVITAETPEGVAEQPSEVSLPASRRSLADEDDSDIEHAHGLTSPLSPEVLSAVPAGGLGFGGLAGFDPAAYRLDGDQTRQLGAQHSFDSSYAGSFAGGSSVAGAAAGATGVSAASTGFDDEPAFGEGSGAGEGSKGAGLMGFEDNAF